MPYYVGPKQFLMRYLTLRRSVRSMVQPGDAVLFRVPSQIASVLEPALHRAGHPYGLEVVGNPTDVFAHGAVRHPLRRLFRWEFTRQLRKQCRRAVAVGYVTESALQRAFPPDPAATSRHYSTIELASDAFRVRSSKQYSGGAGPAMRFSSDTRCPSSAQLLFVGSLAQMYKGSDVLLRAVAVCRDAGVDVELAMVGGGKHLAELQALSAELGIDEHVRFHGEIPSGEPVRALLDQADCFVLPSRTEGLPRAMIEAMARGLPCIGSAVGGIPELLAPEDLVPPGDVASLAAKITQVVTNPTRLEEMATRNSERSRDYASEILSARRRAVYEALRQATEQFAAGPSTP